MDIFFNETKVCRNSRTTCKKRLKIGLFHWSRTVPCLLDDVVCASAGTETAGTGNPKIIKGDVDFDGKVTKTDATLVLKYISADKPFFESAEMNEMAKQAADFENTVGINVLDVIGILKKAN